jgi:tetratricopeptide (TPR) repeat protein
MTLVRMERRVFEPEHKLRHLPFFEEIAAHQEGDRSWRSATAGLVTVRLVDAWLESAPFPLSDEFAARSVRAAIEAVDEGAPLRSILCRVVDSLEEQKPDIHVVITPLMAYAQALEYDAKWRLAADVYHSVLGHLHPVSDGDASIAAHMRLGYCYRNLQLLEDAAEAYASASRIATQVGDMVGVLLARVNEGHLIALRGNLPRAEQILDETIGRAHGDEFQDVRSRALHTRSNVAHFRGDYDLAIKLAYSAFRESQTPTQRDRILNDIAGAFHALGVYSAARDAYLVLSVTAQEQYMRWAATINLLDISSETRAGILFETYRRQVTNDQLPPSLRVALELTLGVGYGRFGEPEKARPHLERAVALAGEHALNQYLFEAEKALQELENITPPRSIASSLSLDVEEVAHAIKGLREKAGV